MTKLLNRLLRRHDVFTGRQPDARPPRYEQPGQRWLLLERGANPSSDYYVRPHIADDRQPIETRDAIQDAPHADDLRPGTRVVVVRYLSSAWAQALHAARGHLAGVAYFMDDDLLDPSTWAGLSREYRQKLARDCAAVHRHIQALADDYWVSTPALRAKYAWLSPRVLPARALPVATTPPITLFYHGTASHRDEQAWLRPIVAEALRENPPLHFEVVGDHEVNRLYRDLPRVSIVHPMSWPNYRAFCESRRRGIGLAPLLPGPFNAARSPLKFFDIARCGAPGVYSDVEPYRGFVADGRDGVLAPNEPQRWVQAIGELVRDSARREQLAAHALARAHAAMPADHAAQAR